MIGAKQLHWASAQCRIARSDCYRTGFMLRHALATRPSIFALMVGAIVLIACTLARLAGQPLVANMPVVAAVSTLLIFLIPGAVAGIIAPCSFFWDGAILGLIAAAFVTLQSFQFYRPLVINHSVPGNRPVGMCQRSIVYRGRSRRPLR